MSTFTYMVKHDILTLDDIKILVDTFYGKVRDDALIGPVFTRVIQDWPVHLDKMYRFWQTILLNEIAYSGSPFLAHMPLPIQKEHFEAWIALWYATIEDLFEGEKANEAKWRADRMSDMFQHKLEHYRNNSAKPLI